MFNITEPLETLNYVFKVYIFILLYWLIAYSSGGFNKDIVRFEQTQKINFPWILSQEATRRFFFSHQK